MIKKLFVYLVFFLSPGFLSLADAAVIELADSSASIRLGSGLTRKSDNFVIRDIEYQSFEGAAKLEIKTNESINYVVYELQDPYRIIIDPLDAIWCDFEETIMLGDGMVKSIKFVKGREMPDGPGAPFYSFDFVTIELDGPIPYKLYEEEGVVTLNIGEEKQIKIAERIDKARLVEEEIMRDFAREEAALRDQKQELNLIKEKLTREKKEIAAAKGDLAKKRSNLEKEKSELVRKKSFWNKKTKKESFREKELEKPRKGRKTKKKFKSRPTKDFSEDMIPPEYAGKTLTLDDCIQIAVSNSMSVKISKEKIELSKMKINEAFRELFPEFSLMWTETQGVITRAHYKGRKFGLEFKQAISHGGEIINVWEQAKINLKIAKENLNKEKENIIFEVSKAYYELAKIINKYDFQKKLLDVAGTDFEMAKKEYDLGLMAELDFMRLEVSLYNYSQVLLTHKNNIALSRLEMKKVMNIGMDAEIDIDSTLEERDIEIDRDECIDLAKQYKPDYRISYFNTQVAKLTERIAHSQTFPQIDIFGKYLKSAERLEPLNVEPLRHFLDNERVLGATVSLPWGPHTIDYQKKRTKLAPTVSTFENDTRYLTDKIRINLFDNMARYTNIKDASVKYKESLDDFNNAEQTIYTEVSEALFAIEEAKLKIKNTILSIELHKRELEEQNFRKGFNEASYSDLVESRNKLFAVMGIHKEALGDYYIAIARVNKAIGLGGYFK